MRGKTAKRQKNRSREPRLDARLTILVVLWVFAILMVLARLVHVQIVKHDEYAGQAKKYLENRRDIAPQRGSIEDRNGEILALDLEHYSLALRPRQLENRYETARAVGAILRVPSERILQRIKDKASFAYISHRLNGEQARKISALEHKGVMLEKKNSRYYPYAGLASQVLGYCDFDNQARGGLELEYDRLLKGKPGWTIYLRDALGNQFPNLDFPGDSPENGLTIRTTLDIVFQSIVEEELKRGVVTAGAANGSAVLVNPRSGEVLAMANYPGYDPNTYNKYEIANFRNRAVTDVFEPGSTFKMIPLALCVSELGMNIDQELVFCENGRFKLADKIVQDHKKFAYLTVRQAFENSSNIAMIKLADKFSAPQMYRYSRDFGFGSKSGVDLPAEARGILHRPANYSGTTVSYMSFGYEVATTPLQLAMAYAAVANDGKLMKPYVVKELVDENGAVREKMEPEFIREVVSAPAADKMKEVLIGVVEDGTGQTARVSGVLVAGKTGTSQKIDRSIAGYSTEKHVASFVGFFPADEPEYVLLVVINGPENGYYGSQVAAPPFQHMAQRILGLPDKSESRKYQLAHVELPGQDAFAIPVEGLSIERATDMLDRQNIQYEVIGNGASVMEQEPAPYTTLVPDQRIRLITEIPEEVERHIMPDVVGLTLKEALQLVEKWDMHVQVTGSGVVSAQSPVAGTRLEYGTRIRLTCQSDTE